MPKRNRNPKPGYAMFRAEARELGLDRFSTGKPCKRGHVAERYVSCGRCIECQREREHKPPTPETKKLARRHYRISAGWSGEQVAFAPLHTRVNQTPGRPHVEHNGVTQSLTDWAHEVGVSLSGLWRRLQRGWSIERALTTPPRSARAAS